MRRPDGQPSQPSTTILSVAVDPADGRVRVDVALHDATLDPFMFAETMAGLMRPFLTPSTGNVRIDVYRGSFDGIDGPMTLVATACELAVGAARPAHHGSLEAPERRLSAS